MRTRLLTSFASTGALVLVMAASSCRTTSVHPVGSYQGTERALATEFTLASWNVQKAVSGDFPTYFRELARKSPPDLVFLQEARSGTKPMPGFGSYFAPAWRKPTPNGDSFGVQTLSRVEPIHVKNLPSRVRELWVITPKMSLATMYPIVDGQTLLAINTHCLNFERLGTGSFRTQIEDLEKLIATHQGPVLLAGDFNTWSARRLEVLETMSTRTGLREITQFPDPRKTAGKGRFLNRLIGLNPHLPLDRVFVRGLEGEEPTVLAIDFSDHRPLTVRLKVK